jgi:hypothetical protein
MAIADRERQSKRLYSSLVSSALEEASGFPLEFPIRIRADWARLCTATKLQTWALRGCHRELSLVFRYELGIENEQIRQGAVNSELVILGLDTVFLEGDGEKMTWRH